MKCVKKPGCKKRAHYGFKGQKHEFCEPHSKEGMINVKDRLCEKLDCKARAIYAIPGLKPIHCPKHKLKKEIRGPRKRCKEKLCKELAIYGYYNHNFCEEHKKDDMINFIENKCKSCGLLTIVSSNFLCYDCETFEFSNIRLAKQNNVKHFLDSNGYSYISSDKIIDGGVCLKYRPDFLFDCVTHYVVLEVDEDQHRSYERGCEYVRMKNIVESLAMPIIFIRYNPDEYKNLNGKKVNTEKKKRQDVLKKTLDDSISIKTFDESELNENDFLKQIK